MMRKKVLDIVGNVDYPYTCAIVNNQRMGFLDEVEEPTDVELLSANKGEGRRTYERTLAFLISYCIKKTNQNYKIQIKHSYGDALYGEIDGTNDLSIITKIRECLKEIVKKNMDIKKHELTKEEAIRRLEREKRFDDIRLLQYLSKDTITLYFIDGYYVYFAGPLLPKTGMLKVFDIVPYTPGFLVLLPRRDNVNKASDITDRRKLFETYQESRKWVERLNVRFVGDLNESIVNKGISKVIKVQEALHEKKISDIADMIKQRNSKIVLIAGPSSSGKTTFAKRLEVQLRVNGFVPTVISTDNYFVDREKTPISEDGKPDYDCFDAINHDLLQEQLLDLIKGKEVQIPRYNFFIGKSEKGKKIKLSQNGVLIVEGIHGLNPALTYRIKPEDKFRVYVSALTQLNIDSINRIPTRDTRLIRRIVRDRHFRGISATETIRRWPTVIRGEEKYIFPFQENADVMFNSALVYELAILRVNAEVALRAIDYKEKEYGEALRLLNFLSHFLPLVTDEIPPTSILREFIGRSSFKY
jgi:uridine kinase